MNELWALFGILVFGGAVGSYITTKWIALITRKRRHAREGALREIASHKWHVGDQSDAVVITRIALRGLEE